MDNGILKIGRIPYANLFPIFHYLDNFGDRSRYEFIPGVPSKLNKMLREGDIDISPSSSIEYLRNKDQYLLLPWFSISSLGPIRSILLFSRNSLKELDGKIIGVTSESETSTVLLKIILEEFFSLKCSFKTFHPHQAENIFSSFSGILHIGDTAMVEAKSLMSNGFSSSDVFIYDLGELWHEYTGLPFVYALWVVRKKSLKQKEDLIKQLSDDLHKAKTHSEREYTAIANDAPQKKWFSPEELVSYWKLISYDFTERHMDGLKLFENFAFKRQMSD